MRRTYLLVITILFLCQNAIAQHADKSWSATGSGNTYTKLQTATGARPQVPCTHSGFTDTAHIDEVMDADLNKHAFRFYMHANADGNYNQCDPAETKERQRNELAYNVSKPTMKVQYKWQMKLPDNFKTTSNFNYNFAHLHQIKLRDGFYKNQPMFTLSAWNDQLILITSTTDWSGDTTLETEPLTNFKGKWVEITEIIMYDDGFSSGRYGIQIKEMHGTKNTLFQFVDNDIQTWKGGAANLQVKWGFYRSRTGFGGSPVFNDLQDEIVLYDSFDVKYLNDSSPINFDTPKVQLTLNSVNGTVATNPSSADNSYELDAQITLTATPATGYEFEKWEGAVTGTNNPATITMNSTKTVSAVFKEKRNLLTITNTNGTVSTNPQSNDNRYGQNTQVSLTATPINGYEFEKWEGDITGTENPTTIIMNSEKSVIAVFKQKQHLLTITAVNGSVTTNPSSSNSRYGQNTQIALTATPNDGFEFEKWEGDITGTENPTTIIMNSAKSVTAVFKQKQHLLIIVSTNGTVSTDPGSSDNTFNQNAQVTLTAIPDDGFEFEKWEGDINETDNPISISMETSKRVKAIFEAFDNDKELTSGFTISSNPVNEILTIGMSEGQEIKMSVVYNLKGQKIQESQNTELDFSTLTSGIYFLKIESTNNEVVLKKIIKR